MGARSGGGGGLGRDGSGSFGGGFSNVESLKNIKDPQLYKAVKQAISRYHSAMGVQQKNIKLADLEAGVLGVHVTGGGQSEAIYLNKALFKTGSVKSITQTMQKDYKGGWATKTNKPVAHTVTHELAHATWNSHLVGTKYKAAGQEIKALYKKWSKDSRKSGYGKYAKTNVNEFFAETVTKAIHGKSDKYTKKVKSIVKDYKL